MKTLIKSLLAMLVLIQQPGYGQWYQRRYNVDDINNLTRIQLEESIQNSKGIAIGGGLTAIVGGVVFFGSMYGWFDPDPEEELTFWQQIYHTVLGEKGVNDVNVAIGAGIMTAGAVVGVVHLSRMGKCRSVLNANYPSAHKIMISPEGIYCSKTGSLAPGIRLTIAF